MEHVDEAHSPEKHDGGHPEINIPITVNGVAEEWHHHQITYDEVVKLAFPDGASSGNVRYSVTWTKPDGEEGGLRPGYEIKVVKDMSFHVRNTDKS